MEKSVKGEEMAYKIVGGKGSVKDMSKHGDKGEGSREHANFSDLISKSGQFGLQRGFL